MNKVEEKIEDVREFKNLTDLLKGFVDLLKVDAKPINIFLLNRKLKDIMNSIVDKQQYKKYGATISNIHFYYDPNYSSDIYKVNNIPVIITQYPVFKKVKNDIYSSTSEVIYAMADLVGVK